MCGTFCWAKPTPVHLDILSMHVLGYAEATAWSRPQPTGKPNEVVRVLIKTQLVE
ncbi:MAG: hypothetical protein HC873_23115 [Leptolyngbyaceae cyanobacterium SL_1_1]|nr:hypothetical protein [Leptolyngbyaceae cyanobacterium SL_1_1]